VTEPPNPPDRPARVVARADLERELEVLDRRIMLDYGLDDRDAILCAVHKGSIPETADIDRWLSLYSALMLWTTDITADPKRGPGNR
jgi:hypothetical protein